MYITIRQNSENSCGLAALKIALLNKKYEYPIHHNEQEDMYSLYDLELILMSNNIESQVLKFDITNFKYIPDYSVVHLKSQHYIVIIKSNVKKVIYCDPADGIIKTLDTTNFYEMCSGYFIDIKTKKKKYDLPILKETIRKNIIRNPLILLFLILSLFLVSMQIYSLILLDKIDFTQSDAVKIFIYQILIAILIYLRFMILNNMKFKMNINIIDNLFDNVKSKSIINHGQLMSKNNDINLYINFLVDTVLSESFGLIFLVASIFTLANSINIIFIILYIFAVALVFSIFHNKLLIYQNNTLHMNDAVNNDLLSNQNSKKFIMLEKMFMKSDQLNFTVFFFVNTLAIVFIFFLSYNKPNEILFYTYYFTMISSILAKILEMYLGYNMYLNAKTRIAYFLSETENIIFDK
jgi:ABC-type bacteriocin/lantibiotic exporter with double-glycine peptidase domain